MSKASEEKEPRKSKEEIRAQVESHLAAMQQPNEVHLAQAVTFILETMLSGL